MTVYERIKNRRKDLGLSADDIAAALGVSRATIYRYESADVEKVPITALEPLAQVLRTTPEYLMGWSNAQPINVPDNIVPIRFLGEVAAGYDHIANEEYEYLNVPEEWLAGRKPSDFFAMRVTGSSMYPMYCDGDEVLCLSCNDMGLSGRVGVFLYGDGEATLKRIGFTKGEDWVDLVPINPEYQTKRIEGRDLECCRVIGRAMRLIRTIEQ